MMQPLCVSGGAAIVGSGAIVEGDGAEAAKASVRVIGEVVGGAVIDGSGG